MNSVSLKSTSPSAQQAKAAASHWWFAQLLAVLLGTLVQVIPASAATLQGVEFASLPGNQVRIDLMFSDATKVPQDFATTSPARIALDFEGVASGLD